MPSHLGSERPTVQDPLIGYAVEIGWGYLSPDEALTLRRGESGTLLYPTLRDKLIALNPGVVTVDNVDQVITRIESVRNTIEGNAEVLAWLRGERSVYVQTEKRQRNVILIDFEHPAHNVFHVTEEWQYTNGQYTNRADVMFLINGIPLAIVETKGARRQAGIDEGIVRLKRYHRETPELMTAPQVFNVTHLIDFYYGATWNLDRKDIFNWKDEERGNFERKAKRFFSRERFLKLVDEWIIFYTRDDELRKIILRQHQTRAVEKVVDRALDPEKTRGLIWHTQGAGKTFTMIKAAEQILRHPAFEKPTVIMLVDRNELEGQLAGWIMSVFGEGEAELARSKAHLRELLRADYRGLIVSMIHKFDRADADLCTRTNVFILVDEAHRSMSGDLGNYLVAALPNATMIGFTGTPIDKIAYGKGTFKVFGKDDPQGYLDKYSISESIEDKTTLPLHYTMAPNDIRVPREQLEKEFLDLVEAEGVSDIEELNRILDKAVKLKAFLKASDRVEQVAQYVARHFRENVEPLGYKAFLVGVDREACALYKRALDRYLPPDYSTVVYSSALDDDDLLAQYRLSEDDETKIRKAFLKRDLLPKILIVTEKLLTGFDAPILYCMYLDKPMRDHTLLQAIARVNRPCQDEDGVKKPAGFVLDFVGI
ncbi:MAG: HsdR family type I site-specific deoxyribonuclease, partial [candidate division NC10 bacterium]|nr:HsdR family type I site-specific deoxyribonuclease [candidate division NC10 bacterium]